MDSAIRSRIVFGVLTAAAVLAAVLLSPLSAQASPSNNNPGRTITADLGKRSPLGANSTPDGNYHHRLRFNELGRHYNVKLRVYMNTPAQRTIELKTLPGLCLVRPSGNHGRDVIRFAANGANQREWTANANDMCYHSTRSIFNRDFTLPAPRADQLDANSGLYFVELTIGYIDPDRWLSTQINGNNRNAIGFRVIVKDAGPARVAPMMDTDRHFSIQANSNDGAHGEFRVPFGLPCDQDANGRQRIRIYDADAGGFDALRVQVYERNTQTRMRLYDADRGNIPAPQRDTFQVNPSAGNRDTASFTFEPERNKNYVLRIFRLNNGNTIDLGLPPAMEAIWGVTDCGTTQTDRHLSINPVMSVVGADLEPGETATGSGYAEVSGFPDLNAGEWPSTGVATQRAVNTGIRAERVSYNAQQGEEAGGASGNVEKNIRCGGGVFRPPSECGQFLCRDNVRRNSCPGSDNYVWECTWGGKTRTAYSSANTRAAMNGCKIFKYYCKNTDGNWRTGDNYQYRDFNNEVRAECNNQWVCPSPSPVSGFGEDDANANCRIFRCYVPEDVSYGTWYQAGGIDDAHQRCDYRCDDGRGDHAILSSQSSDGTWSNGDRNCYYPPEFTVTCAINDGINTIYFSDTVRGNGIYCNTGSVVIAGAPSTGVGGQICATNTITQPPDGAAWPGVGSVLSQNWYFSVSGPDSECVSVVSRPISQVLGGDVSAGASMASGPVCGPTGAASILGWAGSRYAGSTWPSASARSSRTNLAAFATGDIYGFATAHNNSPGAPNGLAFADRWSGSGELYGGGYNRIPCIPDYFANMPPDTAVGGNVTQLTTTVLNRPSGSYSYNTGNLGATAVPVGKKITAYVDGDVRIVGNVVYAGRGDGSWSSMDRIPALRLVVRGNIFIDKAVSELDGSYIAQARADGSGGYIYTCTTSATSLPDDGVYNECRNTPLKIRGSFSAKRVIMDRSVGSAVNGTISEEFRYLPEVWQAGWTGDNSTTQMLYNSIISLPPIL